MCCLQNPSGENGIGVSSAGDSAFKPAQITKATKATNKIASIIVQSLGSRSIGVILEILQAQVGICMP